MVMGPTCGMVLADLGAEVIKVEPVEGDRTRHLLGAGAGFFPMFNRNKKSIALDLRARLAAYSAAELAAVFEKHGLPFAPISRPEQLLDDPHLNATGGLADITLPDGERAGQTARTTLLPLAMDGQRLGVRLQPPALGQHTAALMQELGYTPEQVQALQQAGAVA